MKPTLLILAAGMASRYGSMKQTEGFGPGGETIMDYSIYNAIRAGFGKVIFIIRKDFAEGFKNVFEPRLKGKIETGYVYQEMDSLVNTAFLPGDRTKPWGTGHALLCAKDEVHEPFAVINADDFYGKDAFEKAADFLVNKCSEKEYAIIGYRLANTLSEHGTVSRGVCQVDANQFLTGIQERTKIYSKDGAIGYEENDVFHHLKDDTDVSMNFWCFHPTVFGLTEKLFKDFPEKNYNNLKAEFFIPIIAEDFLWQGGKIRVISTSSKWFGVTYKEDAESVRESLYALIKESEYPEQLWI